MVYRKRYVISALCGFYLHRWLKTAFSCFNEISRLYNFQCQILCSQFEKETWADKTRITASKRNMKLSHFQALNLQWYIWRSHKIFDSSHGNAGEESWLSFVMVRKVCVSTVMKTSELIKHTRLLQMLLDYFLTESGLRKTMPLVIEIFEARWKKEKF